MNILGAITMYVFKLKINLIGNYCVYYIEKLILVWCINYNKYNYGCLIL